MEDAASTEELLNKLCKDASRSFFCEYGLISHQLNSYNDFVENGIHKVFNSIGEFIIEPGYDKSKKEMEQPWWRRGRIRYGKVLLEKPMFWTGEKHLRLLPRHARLQRMTYSSRMKVKVVFEVYVLENKSKTGKETNIYETVVSREEKEIVIGRLLVMVGSNLCWMKDQNKQDCDFDHGGYFIINGMEKVFVAQEQECIKRLWVSDNPTLHILYRTQSKWLKISLEDLKLEDHEPDRPSKTTIITVKFLSCKIPLWVFFFALGMPSDKAIVDMIDIKMTATSSVNILFSTIVYADIEYEGFRKEGNSIKVIEERIEKNKIKESLMDCLDKYLCPGLSSHKLKAMFVGYMVKCLLQSYSGERKCDNRYDFRNKRLELAGELLEREFPCHIRSAEYWMALRMRKHLKKKKGLLPIEHHFDASIITNGLSRAFSTGSWSKFSKKPGKISGVVANLRRTNPLQKMADMRRTRDQGNHSWKVTDTVFPHPSHWGRLCFFTTPDSKDNCGTVKNLAVTGLVSTILMEPYFLDMLLKCGMETLVHDCCTLSLKDMYKIFLNGEWVGVCQDHKSFVSDLKQRRRNNEISPQTEIKGDQMQKEVRIFTDSGRIMRPLLVVRNLERIILCEGDYSFRSLLNQGIVELVGTEEEEDCLTAWGVKHMLQGDKDYTHCELDPSFLLSLSCGIIPFANHNNGKRIMYQSQKHSQQAIGFSTTNPDIRVDTMSQQLYYPQKPLFRTVFSDIHPKPEIYNGQNAIVAVNVHKGYNQEDSFVMNQASVERGMFRTENKRCYKSEADNSELMCDTRNQNPTKKIAFGKVQSSFGLVDKLDEDGFPGIGAHLENGDIIIGRHTGSGVDRSIKLKHTERGRVQKVILSATDERKNSAAVSLIQVRSPAVGDKFSSMHGQKGCIGLLESQENFPFTCQGIVPDIVINPHAFPSRQTPGQLLEAVLGKGIACGGMIRHATPFTTPSVDVITEQLHRLGYSRWGCERVCCGNTGKMMDTMLFIGPTFYQRLDKMAEDQVKFRNNGPVNPLTRQPVTDRKRFGGVRFGEMERDCLVAHGAAANLHEWLFTLSDSSHMQICAKCSNMANVIKRPGGKIRGPYCKFCESAEKIVKVNVPYAAKLLCYELLSVGISVKFGTEPC